MSNRFDVPASELDIANRCLNHYFRDAVVFSTVPDRDGTLRIEHEIKDPNSPDLKIGPSFEERCRDVSSEIFGRSVEVSDLRGVQGSMPSR